MLSINELSSLFETHAIPADGKKLIQYIRDNPPSRAVGGGSTSVKVRYVPQKMPFVLEAEAFQTELAAIVTYDHDEITHEIYTQPTKLKISYRTIKGKKVSHYITPDLFLIRQDGFIFVECKTEQELLTLQIKYPERYLLDESGQWRSPPAETAAAAYGCKFLIRSTAENNWALIENLDFLQDYLRAEELKVPDDAKDLVFAEFEKKSWSTVHELVNAPGIQADWVYSLIVLRELYFEIQEDRLADYEHAIVFRDRQTAQAYRVVARCQVGLANAVNFQFSLEVGSDFKWDGRIFRIANIGEESVWAQQLDRAKPHAELIKLGIDTLYHLAGDGKIQTVAAPDSQHDSASEAKEMLRRASPNDIQIANQKYMELFGAPENSKNPYSRRSARTKAYWRESWRNAENRYGQGFIGLLPNPHKTQGNHACKLDGAVATLIDEVISNEWESIRQKSFAQAFGKLALCCRDQGFISPSYQTFVKWIKKRKSHKSEIKRVGEKAAYDSEPHFLVLEFTTPRHGNRPFHIGHIDHTPIPLKLVDKSLGSVMKEVWLTILMDAFSRKVLAYYLSFDKPSYRSCMMVIRDCVRRHGRVPLWIVVDQGADFISTFFEQLLALLRVNKKERPAGKPRFGSTMERLFKTTVDQFVQVLLGSTKIYEEHFRQVNKRVDPVRHANWTLDRFQIRLEEYFMKAYHQLIHSTLGMTPEAAFDLGIQESGARSHSLITYTHEFIIHTMPSTPKGVAKVTHQGVKIKYRYFNCAAFNLPGVLGTSVPVRFDPDNFGRAYAYVNGNWEECISEYYSVFQGYTEKQIQLTTKYLHLKARQRNAELAINAKVLAEFLDSVEAEELLEVQKLKDRESLPHRQMINHVPAVQPNSSLSSPMPPSSGNRRSKPVLIEDL